MKAIGAVLVVSFSLLSASVASAADMFTPPLGIFSADTVNCRVLNTGTGPANNVTIEIKDETGFVHASTGPISIAGRTTADVTDTGPNIAYCHVRGVAPSKTRVTLCSQTATLVPIACTTTP
jgi:hypothetical protein